MNKRELEFESALNRVSLRWQGHPVVVHSNTTALVEFLADYFSPWLDPAPADSSSAGEIFVYQGNFPSASGLWRENELWRDFPTRQVGTPAKEAYLDTPAGRLVLKKRTGILFFITRGPWYVAGDVLSHRLQVVNLINHRWLGDMLAQGCLALHGAGVAGPGGGVGLIGPSGVGKSTLALRLVGRGFRLVANDRVIIGQAGLAPGQGGGEQVGRGPLREIGALGPAAGESLPRGRDKGGLPGGGPGGFFSPDSGVPLGRGDILLYGLPQKPRVNPGTLLSVHFLRHYLSPAAQEEYSRLEAQELWELERKYTVELEEPGDKKAGSRIRDRGKAPPNPADPDAGKCGCGPSGLPGRGGCTHLQALFFLHWERQSPQPFTCRGLAPEEIRREIAHMARGLGVLELGRTDTRVEVPAGLVERVAETIPCYRLEGGIEWEEMERAAGYFLRPTGGQ